MSFPGTARTCPLVSIVMVSTSVRVPPVVVPSRAKTRVPSVPVTPLDRAESTSPIRIWPAMLRNQGCSDDRAEGPWNPGIRSELTRELLPLSTVFRQENVFDDLTQAMELRDVTGLPLEDLAIFRPERLALHEL